MIVSSTERRKQTEFCINTIKQGCIIFYSRIHFINDNTLSEPKVGHPYAPELVPILYYSDKTREQMFYSLNKY